MQNFNHPYTATTIKEFWSRWHISLSSWFKDYLYFPLGGSRCSKPRHLMNLFIVFLVSGLWHGAAWTYVIWGAIHGFYQIVGNLTLKSRDKLLNKVGLAPKGSFVTYARRFIVFILVDFAWLFFRANTTGDAFSLIGTLFTGWDKGLSATLSHMGLGAVEILTTVLMIATLIMIDHLLRYEDVEGGSYVLTRNGSFIYYVWMIMFAWAILLSKDMSSTFIYFQF
jgi:D-alanyl-lipoteichoic acid acyltransferase DltB (MBOAT superfamily)